MPAVCHFLIVCVFLTVERSILVDDNNVDPRLWITRNSVAIFSLIKKACLEFCCSWVTFTSFLQKACWIWQWRWTTFSVSPRLRLQSDGITDQPVFELSGPPFVVSCVCVCDVDRRLLVSVNSVALRVYYFTTPVGFYLLLTRRGNIFKFETFVEINNFGIWSTEVRLQ